MTKEEKIRIKAKRVANNQIKKLECEIEYYKSKIAELEKENEYLRKDLYRLTTF